MLYDLLIVAFFSIFSTNILLSFTPETYTYTLFLLVLFNYYTAIKFKKDQKIAGSALVLAGVTIGSGCIIGAGSVVTKSIPDYSIAVGNPARITKTRN